MKSNWHRVIVGDRVARLSDGKIVGSVIEVLDGGAFMLLYDEPTAKMWDANRGRIKVRGLAEGRLQVVMSAVRDRAGNRNLGFDGATVAYADLVAKRHEIACSDAQGEFNLDMFN